MLGSASAAESVVVGRGLTASSLPPPPGGVVSGVRLDRGGEAEEEGPTIPLAHSVGGFGLRLGAVEERPT